MSNAAFQEDNLQGDSAIFHRSQPQYFPNSKPKSRKRKHSHPLFSRQHQPLTACTAPQDDQLTTPYKTGIPDFFSGDCLAPVPRICLRIEGNSLPSRPPPITEIGILQGLFSHFKHHHSLFSVTYPHETTDQNQNFPPSKFHFHIPSSPIFPVISV